MKSKDTIWYEVVGKKWLSYHDKEGRLKPQFKDYWDKEADIDIKLFERALRKEEAKEHKAFDRITRHDW